MPCSKHTLNLIGLYWYFVKISALTYLILKRNVEFFKTEKTNYQSTFNYLLLVIHVTVFSVFLYFPVGPPAGPLGSRLWAALTEYP